MQIFQRIRDARILNDLQNFQLATIALRMLRKLPHFLFVCCGCTLVEALEHLGNWRVLRMLATIALRILRKLPDFLFVCCGRAFVVALGHLRNWRVVREWDQRLPFGAGTAGVPLGMAVVVAAMLLLL